MVGPVHDKAQAKGSQWSVERWHYWAAVEVPTECKKVILDSWDGVSRLVVWDKDKAVKVGRSSIHEIGYGPASNR